MSNARRLPPGLLLLAHRGASRQAPENTRVALEKALELGADGVEVDVQRTVDGTLILVHDDDWLRTAGRAADVASTPWTEASRFDVGSWFDASYAATPPARLQDALDVLPPEALLNLELKSPHRYPGIGSQVLRALRDAVHPPRVLITSFDGQCIEALAAADASVEYGYLGTWPQPLGGAVKTQVLAMAAILREPEVIGWIHASGGQVLAWTVDDPEVAQHLADLGVDGLISNDPSRLRPRRPTI